MLKVIHRKSNAYLPVFVCCVKLEVTHSYGCHWRLPDKKIIYKKKKTRKKNTIIKSSIIEQKSRGKIQIQNLAVPQ